MVSSNPHRVSNIERCCHGMATCYLQLVNVIDFLLGCSFLVFAIYLWSKLGANFQHAEIAWLGWSCLLLGILLLSLCAFSFCAIATKECRCLLSPTDWIAVLIVLMCLVLGIVSIELRSLFLSELRDNGNKWGLSNSDFDTIDSWYYVVCVGFFVSMAFEILRVFFTHGYKNRAVRIESEFENLLNQEQKEWEDRFASNKTHTERKYKDLRSYYKQKYAKPVDTAEGALDI